MKKLAAPLLILFFIVFHLLSCDGLDENYSSNPNHRLSFSVDTLSFDTVFTTIGSATKEFMIYNRNDQPLLISEIMLQAVKRPVSASTWTGVKATISRI